MRAVEDAIRAEIWPAQRLAEFGALFGSEHQTAAAAPTHDLRRRAIENQAALESAYRALATAVQRDRAVTHAAKWLLDNFHVVAEHFAELTAMLSRASYRRLPAVATGRFKGHVRVYAIAYEYVAHTDSRFERESLRQFVEAFQQSTQLTMREVWALPVLLRAVLLENLRRIATRTAASLAARERADQCVDELVKGRPQRGEREALPEPPPLPERDPYVVQLVQRLQDQLPESATILRELQDQLARHATSVEETVRSEHARRAASNVTVRNIITSLREVSSLDWRDFFESVSAVDATLDSHPSYRAIDFNTRDRYRHAIEELARGSGRTEVEVAELVLQLAETARDGGAAPADPRTADVGYFLIDDGRRALETTVSFAARPSQRLRRAILAHPFAVYGVGIAALTLALLALAFRWGLSGDTAMLAGLLLGVCSLFPLSETAIAIVNRVLVSIFPPVYLPRLVWREGIPDEHRTLVVLPVLIGSEAEVRRHIWQLETHANANPASNVGFALLSDWPDSSVEIDDEDRELLQLAHRLVDDLNQRYAARSATGPLFHLFHRRRQWNDVERCWMGWERKRGKLVELNRLLRGETGTSFIPAGGDLAWETPVVAPQGVRYVLTVDADTRLPMGIVNRLVGTAAHPLNRPVYGGDGRVVVRGYGIMQPRVTPLLPERAEDSLYQEIDARGSGLDPYAGAVSNVYQDVFGQAIFTGKGLYDVDAVERVLRDRIPDNTLLSHDLFEGTFARTALVTDAEVFEDFPSHSEVAAARQHRWTRGDWQLLPWLLHGDGPDAIPTLGRWQMIDNLRRSLVAPFAWLALVTSWCLSGANPLVWLIVALAPAIDRCLMELYGLCRNRLRGAPVFEQLGGFLTESVADFWRLFVTVALMAQHSWLMIDAVARALYRRYVSGRKLLEWTTAEHARERARYELRAFVWPLKSSTIIVVTSAAIVLAAHPAGFSRAWPLLLLWWSAPLLARALSTPSTERRPRDELSDVERSELLRIARRVWSFFETFVTAADNHLPPDNFQEHPGPVVAHRTSPTNIGVYLLSIQTARDLGWLGLFDMLDRVENTLATVQRLERYRGHLYNWYDTETLRPLPPRYISTVDSGNLAGHLLALKQALLEETRRPALARDPREGVHPGAVQIARQFETLERAVGKAGPEFEPLRFAIDQIQHELTRPTRSGLHAHQALQRAETCTQRLMTYLGGLSTGIDTSELKYAIERFVRDVRSLLRDAETLLPDELAAPPPHHANMPVEPSRWTVAQAWSVAELAGDDPIVDVDVEPAADLVEPAADLVEPAADLAAQAALAPIAKALHGRLARAAELCEALVARMEFGFLFDTTRRLFSIGYRVEDSQLDPSYYDLLASEARLASLLAVAKGDVPVSHWFNLGRRLGGTACGPVLLSWSGSMFEYLMPSLVMRDPSGSLLDQTAHRAVLRQIGYGRERRVPWGISESAYNLSDRSLTYQYGAFGVPGLGLKRGLGADLVVAPYATALALPYARRAAVRNLRRLAELGANGRYGYYEALDFTRERLPDSQHYAVVRAYMAHHQGMSLAAIGNVLTDGALCERFHFEPRIRAAELVLQERCVQYLAARHSEQEHSPHADIDGPSVDVERILGRAAAGLPAIQLLSNRRYAVMLTSSGGGYSVCDRQAVTRYRADLTTDSSGSWLFVRDAASGETWSATLQPLATEPDFYEARFRDELATFVRRDGDVMTTTEVVVSPEDDAEIRRITLYNEGSDERTLDVVSYAEVVLGSAAADQMHPAFSNLFVETEALAGGTVLLATRRPRVDTDVRLWAAHVVQASSPLAGPVRYETDRARFIGRGRTLRNAAGLEAGTLSNSAGSTLDPIFSLRCRVLLAPGERVQLAFTTLVTASREAAVALAEKYRDPGAFERQSTSAWTFARAEQHYLRIDLAEARAFQALAGHVVFANDHLRTNRELIAENALGAAALWRFGISGDLPIVLVSLSSVDEVEFAAQVLRAQAYWRVKRLDADIVILNEQAHSYAQTLQSALEAVAQSNAAIWTLEAAAGGAHVLRADLMSPEECRLLYAAARVVLRPGRGSLSEQLYVPETQVPPRPRRGVARAADPTQQIATPALELGNGYGGFAAHGREYVVSLEPGVETPAPWVNVIANPGFGTVVSASGAAFSWAQNSRENQLTAWSNDPVIDPSPEVLYLRDQQTGDVWTPTAHPIRLPDRRYVAAHGQGYSRFELAANGVRSELLVFVSPDAPVKTCVLTLENLSRDARRLAVTAYVEWCLGSSRSRNAPFVITQIDATTRAMLVRNAWNSDFGGRVAFVDMHGHQASWTGDRREFLGRLGDTSRPLALERRDGLSGRVGAVLDPCSALQTLVELPPGARKQVVVTLGQAANQAEVIALIRRSRQTDIASAFMAIEEHWQRRLGAIVVETPDRSIDLLMNRWLLYQTLSCRVWARAGFYQAGGAYGFRDQLQDGMALMHAARDDVRAHLLRAAARQFKAGDVQHWWHPPTGRGVRTHFADDRFWLPLAVEHYVDATGDFAVLDEPVSFLSGPSVPPDREDAHFEPEQAGPDLSLYEHCALAIDSGAATGVHGLPLMGGGDWNDGMNLVGRGGRGESVWLAWFQVAVLRRFLVIARQRHDSARAARWAARIEELAAHVEAQAWDGLWYRRAYFDDGTPLGSTSGTQCRIDSIAQSWAVISAAGDRQRTQTAIDAALEHLYLPEPRLMTLLAPAFDSPTPSPGYIAGYPPGVRENGGQYSHGAVWSLIALAELKRAEDMTKVLEALNPVLRARSANTADLYRLEPYVMPGDVYSRPPHVGRGGWSWYTGAAAWYYRAILEWVLGVRIRAATIELRPCLPPRWSRCAIRYRTTDCDYRVVIEKRGDDGRVSVMLDGEPQPGAQLPLLRDGNPHEVLVQLH
jgi:cyclic beta-1,2-glucan synthetase